MGENTSIPSINAETFIPDQLIAGGLKLVTATVTLSGSGKIARGTVLGQISTSGSAAYKISTTGASDGSQNPVAILADNADTTSGNVTCGVYLMGEFDENYIIFDLSWTADSLLVPLRKVGIFLKPTVSMTYPTGE